MKVQWQVTRSPVSLTSSSPLFSLPLSCRRRIVRWKECALGLLVVDALKRMIPSGLPGANDSGARINGRFTLGYAASGSSATLRTREARSSHPQADMSAIV
jgi:hypothetical protein